MSSLFHHEPGMCVKDRVGLRPGIGSSPPLLEGRKELGRLGIERGLVVLVGLNCSEFDIRSIGLLISINAGIQMEHILTESKH